jgi:hypothetical protein
MDAITAVITAEEEFTMTTPNAEEQTTLVASGAAQEPKAATKPNTTPEAAHLAPDQASSKKGPAILIRFGLTKDILNAMPVQYSLAQER